MGWRILDSINLEISKHDFCLVSVVFLLFLHANSSSAKAKSKRCCSDHSWNLPVSWRFWGSNWRLALLLRVHIVFVWRIPCYSLFFGLCDQYSAHRVHDELCPRRRLIIFIFFAISAKFSFMFIGRVTFLRTPVRLRDHLGRFFNAANFGSNLLR